MIASNNKSIPSHPFKYNHIPFLIFPNHPAFPHTLLLSSLRGGTDSISDRTDMQGCHGAFRADSTSLCKT